MEILNNIPVNLTPEKIYKKLQMRRENKTISKSVQELLETVRPIVKPKAVYEISSVANKNGNSLDIDGIKFTSRILRVNFDEVHRAFPYIVTCGREIDEIKASPSNIMEAFILDAIREVALHSAFRYLKEYLAEKYALGHTSRMAPGELEDWPITQQKELFAVFGDVEELIGVRLTKSFLMTPIKSTSGILFPNKTNFESCHLCPIKNCTGRRVPYDPIQFEKYELKALDKVG